MASTSFVKDTGCTGIVCFLLLGLLLQSVLLSGQTTTPPPTTSGATTTPSTTTQPLTTITSGGTTTMTTTQPPTSGATSTSTTQPPTTTSGSATTITTMQPSTSTTSRATTTSATTQSPTTTSSSTATTTTQSPTTTTTANSTPSTSITSASPTANSAAKSSTTMMASSWTSSSSPTTLGSGSSLMSYTGSSTGGMSSMNGTTMSNSSLQTQIYCPSFICNYSDCYTMYTNQNATSCAADSYCQLFRQTDICYIASCSASCADSCLNTSQTNCSVNCCNSTGCLNGSFTSMMVMMTTDILSVIAMTTRRPTTIPVIKTTAANPQTTADKGNKCHTGTCTGTNCYTSFKTKSLQRCSSSHPHCQLKKETNLQWIAGCTNCSGHTPCKASTQPPCHLECCNATMASCLWLNGTLNVPSFATRGPHLHTELIASLLCLFAISFLL
ncbi:hypothetical protein PAMP_002835 [Pampus punctatissimus]